MPIDVTTIADVAEALKDALAAAPSGTFSEAFVPERVWEPLLVLEDGDLNGLRVLVAAQPMLRTTVSRADVERDVNVDIVILKKLNVDPSEESGNTLIDSLVKFVQQLAEFPKFVREQSGQVLECAGAKYVRTEGDAVFDREAMRTQARLFQSQITYVFKLQS